MSDCGHFLLFEISKIMVENTDHDEHATDGDLECIDAIAALRHIADTFLTSEGNIAWVIPAHSSEECMIEILESLFEPSRKQLGPGAAKRVLEHLGDSLDSYHQDWLKWRNPLFLRHMPGLFSVLTSSVRPELNWPYVICAWAHHYYAGQVLFQLLELTVEFYCEDLVESMTQLMSITWHPIGRHALALSFQPEHFTGFIQLMDHLKTDSSVGREQLLSLFDAFASLLCCCLEVPQMAERHSDVLSDTELITRLLTHISPLDTHYSRHLTLIVRSYNPGNDETRNDALRHWWLSMCGAAMPCFTDTEFDALQTQHRLYLVLQFVKRHQASHWWIHVCHELARLDSQTHRLMYNPLHLVFAEMINSIQLRLEQGSAFPDVLLRLAYTLLDLIAYALPGQRTTPRHLTIDTWGYLQVGSSDEILFDSVQKLMVHLLRSNPNLMHLNENIIELREAGREDVHTWFLARGCLETLILHNYHALVPHLFSNMNCGLEYAFCGFQCLNRLLNNGAGTRQVLNKLNRKFETHVERVLWIYCRTEHVRFRDVLLESVNLLMRHAPLSIKIMRSFIRLISDMIDDAPSMSSLSDGQATSVLSVIDFLSLIHVPDPDIQLPPRLLQFCELDETATFDDIVAALEQINPVTKDTLYAVHQFHDLSRILEYASPWIQTRALKSSGLERRPKRPWSHK